MSAEVQQVFVTLFDGNTVSISVGPDATGAEIRARIAELVHLAPALLRLRLGTNDITDTTSVSIDRAQESTPIKVSVSSSLDDGDILGSVLRYFDIGTHLVEAIDNGHLDSVRNAAITLEHTEAEWAEIEARASAENRKPQPRRLSTYNRAVNLARSLQGSTREEISERVAKYLSTSPSYPSVNNFIQWLLNRPQHEVTNSASEPTWEQRVELIRTLLAGSGDPRSMWAEVEP